MDDLTVARALHVAALVHWIGGVSMVALVLLPGITRAVPAADRLQLFEMIEGRFARQARLSTLVGSEASRSRSRTAPASSPAIRSTRAYSRCGEPKSP